MQKFLSQIVVRLSNTSRVLDMSDFWIFLRQGSSYASGCNYGRVLNISEFWVCQVSSCANVAQIERITQTTEYPRISPNIFYQCLNMHKYTLITLNMIEYACIYLKKKQSIEFYIILNVPDAAHGIRSPCKLLSCYIKTETYSKHCQTFKMDRFGKRRISECRYAIRNFSWQGHGGL